MFGTLDTPTLCSSLWPRIVAAFLLEVQWAVAFGSESKYLLSCPHVRSLCRFYHGLRKLDLLDI